MRRDWLLTAGVVLALALLAAWVVHNTEWRDEQVFLPLKGEARSNPFYAAAQLVRSLGAQAHTPLSLEALPPPGAVLVLTSNHWNLFPERQAALRKWVQDGGRLVVPYWLVDRDSALHPWLQIREWRKERKADEDSGNSPKTQQTPPKPDVGACSGGCPWFEGRGVESEQEPIGYRICRLYGAYSLERAAPEAGNHVFPTQWSLVRTEGERSRVVAMRIQVEHGAVTVVADEDAFTWRQLLDGDHARLLIDLMQLRRGDTVWFIHDEDADALPVLLWKTGAPVVLLLLACGALIAWRSAVRFGPLMSEPALGRRSLAEQIRGTAEFLVRQGRARVLWKAQLRALDEAAARAVHGWAELTEVQRQHRLVRHCALDAAQLAQARALPAQASSRDVAQAIAVLESARRRLLSVESVVGRDTVSPHPNPSPGGRGALTSLSPRERDRG